MDKIFKIGILVLGFSYLVYLFCPITNQAGRYQYYTDSDSMSIYDSKDSIVFDTSTGMIYSVSLGKGRITFDVNKHAKQGDKDEQLIFKMNMQEKINEMKAEKEAENIKK